MTLKDLKEKLNELPDELLTEDVWVYREESDKYMRIYEVIHSDSKNDFAITIEVD
jgi:hypothetical protein